jgi:hypothetical protein
MRGYGFAVLVGLTLLAPAQAQAPAWRFRWQPGQALHYRVDHLTTVTETVAGKTTETTAKLGLVKRWQVQAVDAQGVATVQLSVTAMRNEQTRPDGSVLLFDSANPDKSTPELREQLTKYIGQPLALLRVDAYGRVIEVKQGDAKRYESEPPFVLVLPEAAPSAGQSWKRAYRLTLNPPLGTGEQYDLVQKYVCDKSDGAGGYLRLSTTLKNPPASLREQAPLLQNQPEGEIVFDVRSGRLHSARLAIDKVLEKHQGEGSSYRFKSSYTEQYQANN